MYIKKLILYRYKRFLLSNIELLEYTPKNIIQMIASRNLAGKSSLLKQLNPLPADIKKDFKEDGYKIIEISHLGNEYVLTSNTKHSFICNNTELNPGGTKKVQLDLVKEHFNITPAIMDIINNLNRVTQMSPSERKYWFTEMSSVDYTFPIKVYKLMKQQQRDYVGGIKLVQENIIKSELNQKTKEELERLTENRKMLEQYIEFVNSLYDHNIRSDKDLNIYNEKQSKTESLLSTLKELDTEQILSLKDLKEHYNKSVIELEQINKDKERITKELNTIDSLVHLGSKKELLEEAKSLNNKVNSIKNSFFGLELNLQDIDPYKGERYKSIIDGYKTIYGEFVSYLNELQQYDNVRIISKDNKDKIRKEYEQFTLVKTKLISLIIKANTEIEYMKKHKTEENLIDCPKCFHKFYKGYSEDSLKELDNILKQYQDKMVRCDKKIEELKIVVDKLDQSDKLIEQIMCLIRNRPEVKPIVEFIFRDNSLQTTNVSSIISKVNQISPVIDYLEKIDKISDRLVVISKSIEQIEQAEKANLQLNESRVKKLEQELVELNKKSINLTNDLKESNRLINLLTKLKEDYENLLEINKKLQRGYEAEIKQVRNEYLTKLSSELKGILIEIDNTLNDSKNALTNLTNSKKLLEDYKVKEKVLNLMSKELSPDEGLIAKSINSFISVIIEEMNQVINSIWTYDLELLPCEVSEDNDLDYKFKVRVNNDHIVEDIGKLSSSGQEIVDLAFRLVFAKYIGLVEIPLYLDEFGSTFDQAHRTAAYAVIDKILSSDYGQIFIVCHFSQIYGAFKNIDFNVLDANNIDMPTNNEINEVLKLKYYT